MPSLLRRKNKCEKEAPANVEHSEDASTEVILCLPEANPQTTQSSQNITCPNNKCGKIFDTPLELTNLAKISDESSLICPYCLSKLEPTQPTQPEQTVVTETLADEKVQDATKEEVGKCPQFFGYLNKRPKNVPIPEFCLTCPQVMKCLLE